MRYERPFSRGDLHFGQTAIALVSEKLTERDRERERRLRDKISEKIFSELRPKDVLYQILHGLKKLLQYDHSASVLLLHPDGNLLTVQAEIIAWTKAKSDRIGQQLPIETATLDWMAEKELPLLVRDGRPIVAEDVVPDELLRLPDAPSAKRSRAVLLGVLRRKDQILGLVQIRAKHPAAFTPENLVTLEKFLPLASATVYNSELYEMQQNRLVTAERKVGLGELARAISHDLNNSFGVILPLLQASRRDLARGGIDEEKLGKDLEVVEHYASFSARIFSGLLSVGRGASEPYSWTNVNALLEYTLSMIEPNLKAHRIVLTSQLDPEVPLVCLRKGEFEQVLLNLIYNARDAMPAGGTLEVSTRPERSGIVIELVDSGVGIEDDLREKIFEPFFTTKETGTGLGLDICRSIVWEYGGTLHLEANDPKGTIASIWMPPSTERVPTDLLEAHGLSREKASTERPEEAEPVVGYRMRTRK
jgi:signal transduction histidine kinase